MKYNLNHIIPLLRYYDIYKMKISTCPYIRFVPPISLISKRLEIIENVY